MACHKAVYQWTEVVTTHRPPLSKPQAAVLALWSVGMVRARSCALRGYPETVYGLGCLFSVMEFVLGHRAQAMKH
jgi:hypothetical protein